MAQISQRVYFKTLRKFLLSFDYGRGLIHIMKGLDKIRFLSRASSKKIAFYPNDIKEIISKYHQLTRMVSSRNDYRYKAFMAGISSWDLVELLFRNHPFGLEIIKI